MWSIENSCGGDSNYFSLISIILKLSFDGFEIFPLEVMIFYLGYEWREWLQFGTLAVSAGFYSKVVLSLPNF